MAEDDIEYEGEEMRDVPEAREATGIIGTIMERFRNAESGRQLEEERWLKAYKNYRGVYDSSTQYRSNERSQVFIKITKTKVLAAYGQIVDILFANNKFPISVESTPMPVGIDEFAHLSKQPIEEPQLQDNIGFQGDGRELLPGATEATPTGPQPAELGGLTEKYNGANLASGPSKMMEPQISPASEAAPAALAVSDIVGLIIPISIYF